MNQIAARSLFISLVLLIAGTPACVSSHKLPLIDGKETVAMVNDEPITRKEYEQEISAMHAAILENKESADAMSEGKKDSGKKPGQIDFAGLLNRMIDVRLIVQEAKRIGLNDLPEVREEVESYSQKALRTILMKQAIKDVKPDEGLVEKLYQKTIHEWKFASVMFPKEEDAKHMETELQAGGNFDELVRKAVAGGTASGGKDEGYLDGNDVLEPIGDALLTMQTGSVSPIITIPGGYAIAKLEDARVEESPEKREWAGQEALRLKKVETSKTFIESLKKKFVKTDTALLDSLDFEASPEEYEKLAKDERVISDLGNDDRIKVSDLAEAIRRKYFHGVERAIGKGDLNTKKYLVLDGLIERKVLVKEAYLEGIDKNEDYLVLARTYENSLAFGMFVQRVVLPEIKVMESEIRAHYDGHLSDFTTPEMMRLDSVVFKDRRTAEDVMRKLRSGDQLSWIKANAEGQVELDKDDQANLILDGNVVPLTEMAEGLKKSLSGAEAGDFRLYESPDNNFYVISVMAVYPPKTQDYVAVREQIARKLYNEHVQAGVADWVAKLRSTADVKVYLND